MPRTFVIAEAGSSHDADLDKAKRLVEAAKACGADAVKFQYWSSSGRLANRRNAPELEAMYEKYRVPFKWLTELEVYAAKVGIEFMCTTYLPEDIAVVNPLVERFKIASFEAGDVPFVQAHVNYDKEIIVSLGLGGWTVAYLHRLNRKQIKLLHCVSGYPCPPDQLNLAVLDRSKSDGHEPLDGLSDHTGYIQIGGLAVAAGATIIEAHIRLGDTDPANPDYGHSLRADQIPRSEFELYVLGVHQAERIMGDGERKIMPCEEANLKYKVRS